ncbi:MAG: phage holin family protein [Chitinophagaceae bacterium]|nr:phage holin family protein [Chitinophagaceae bacterium]
MEDLKEKTVDLMDHVEGIADTFYKLTVVNATQKATNVTSGVLAAIIISVFGFFFILFAGISLCWWLGNLMDNRSAGFLVGAGIFLLIMVILVAIKKQIIFPYFRDIIIRRFYD